MHTYIQIRATIIIIYYRLAVIIVTWEKKSSVKGLYEVRICTKYV